jgi:hypothetical protein
LTGLKRYLRENWGAPFVLAFMVLLLASAAELSYGLTDAANNTAVYAFYALVLGVALQVAAYVRYGPGEEEGTQEVATPPSHPPRPPWDGRKKVLAISVAAVVLLSAGAAVYLESAPIQTVVFHQTYPALTARVAYTVAFKEPNGTVIVGVGVSVNGGDLPYRFVATWSDGVVQSNALGGFDRAIGNQTVPTSVKITVTSADGQNVTLTAQIPPPT